MKIADLDFRIGVKAFVEKVSWVVCLRARSPIADDCSGVVDTLCYSQNLIPSKFRVTHVLILLLYIEYYLLYLLRCRNFSVVPNMCSNVSDLGTISWVSRS